jgi:hypothetical protein
LRFLSRNPVDLGPLESQLAAGRPERPERAPLSSALDGTLPNAESFGGLCAAVGHCN